jgi:hypothetical protein
MAAGRVTVLTEHTQRIIVDAIRCGNTLHTAAKYAGVSKYIFDKWVRTGRAAVSRNNKYRKLVEDMDQALADFERLMVRYVFDSAKTNIADAKWLLERRHAETWGKKTQVKSEVTKNITWTELVNQSTEKLTKKREGTTGKVVPFGKDKKK